MLKHYSVLLCYFNSGELLFWLHLVKTRLLDILYISVMYSETSLRKVCQNTGFIWPVSFRIRVRKEGVRENPSEFCPISRGWGELGISNLTNVSNEMSLNAAKYQGYSFYRFWVIKGKPIRWGERGWRGGDKTTALQIWVNKGKFFGALLTDLCKAFDCFSHDYLRAKLDAYGFSLSTLKLTRSYLKNRKRKAEIDATCNSWKETIFGVPQRSILGPLLFNIFICNFFFSMNETDFASYDNTPFVTRDSIDDVINSLENDSTKLFK